MPPFTANNDNVKKVNYNVFLLCADASISSPIIVGGCLSEPSITEEKGDDIKLNDGTSPVISKNCGVAFTLVNVDKNNYDLLKSCINKKATIILSTAATHNGTVVAGEWKIVDVMLFPSLTIKGNAVNQIEVSGTKEVGATDATTVVTA